MTRTELVERVAQRHRALAPRIVELAVRTIFQGVTEWLARGQRIEIRGFGTLKVRERRAGERRDPRTGGRIWVPAQKVPVFKAAREMRLRVAAAAARPRRGQDAEDV